MADPRVRQLRIKTGVAKRLAKEKTVYEKEAEQQKQRVEKMKAEGKDEYDIKKQEDVLQECLMMIPDSLRRLNVAISDLKNLLDNESDLMDSEDYEMASTLIQDIEKTLK